MIRHILNIIFLASALNCFAQFNNVRPGDIIDINGIKGIVYKVDDSGKHGTAMSLNVFRSKKDNFCSKAKLLNGLSMCDENNGKSNTTEVFNKFSGSQLSNFPAFNWCRGLGSGWYIPATNQLREFISFWLGQEEEEDWDEFSYSADSEEEAIPHYKLINQKMMSAGGVPFINGVFSSTIDNKGRVGVFEFEKDKNTFRFKPTDPMKLDRYAVCRAIYDF